MTSLLAAGDLAPVLRDLRNVSVEDLLLPLLIQLAVIILVARVLALLFRRFLGQPAVIGEIAAGLVLGPSCLGALFPGVFRAIFHPGIPGLDPQLADALLGKILMAISQIGLV